MGGTEQEGLDGVGDGKKEYVDGGIVNSNSLLKNPHRNKLQ